jgi:CheY-like chemotaxis protein
MASLRPGLKPGHYVRLSVTDTGVGMSSSVLERIFDPFFTTKGKGKGTGLGLAVVHGIIQQHGGTIGVYSVPGEGTTFQLYLPATSASRAPFASTPPMPLADTRQHGAGEAILLVDDEAQVLAVAAAILLRHGYRPVIYQDPLQALAAVREQPGHWRLVITDQLMPAMKGTKLAEEIWKLHPQQPIILATGFAGNLDASAINRLGFAGLLNKPFTRDSLLSLVGHVLRKQA